MRAAQSLFFFALFLVFSSMQFTPEQKKIFQVRLSMPFVTKNSDLEVYVFTDWNSPLSQQVEATLEKLSPEIIKEARLYFVDFPSEGSAGYTAANLTYLINANKKLDDYFKFRTSLLDMAAKDPKASEQQVGAFLKSRGINYQPAPQDIMDVGLRVYQSAVKNLKVSKAPSMVVYNLKNRQSRLIEGIEELTPQKVMSVIEEMKTSAPAEKI